MKKILYFDASSGVSGDMFVGALIDAGADIEIIRSHIDSLGLEGFSIIIIVTDVQLACLLQRIAVQ